VDLPIVRTTATFHLTTLPQHLAFANGVLVEDGMEEVGGTAAAAVEGATTTTHWRLDFPCPSYLLCVAAGALLLVKEESKESKDLLPSCPIAYIAPVGVEEEKLRLAFQVRMCGLSFPPSLPPSLLPPVYLVCALSLTVTPSLPPSLPPAHCSDATLARQQSRERDLCLP
jgi:hypothetical protein